MKSSLCPAEAQRISVSLFPWGRQGPGRGGGGTQLTTVIAGGPGADFASQLTSSTHSSIHLGNLSLAPMLGLC